MSLAGRWERGAMPPGWLALYDSDQPDIVAKLLEPMPTPKPRIVPSSSVVAIVASSKSVALVDMSAAYDPVSFRANNDETYFAGFLARKICSPPPARHVRRFPGQFFVRA